MGDFPSIDYETWRARVEAELQARPFDSLVTHTPEGVDVQPVYGPDASLPEAGYPGLGELARGGRPLGTAAGWDVCQRHVAADPADVSASIAADLAAGATGAWLDVNASGWQVSDLARALDGVDLANTALLIDAGDHALEAAQLVTRLARQCASDPSSVRVAFGVTLEQDLATMMAFCRDNLPVARAVISARAVHDGGGNAVQEIGYAAATAVQHLRVLAAAQWSIDDAAPALGLSFSIGRDVFMEIAKLRATRVVWAKILSASGAARPVSSWIHATGSARTLTRRDPWVNMLRATTQTFAAIAGGADSITSTAFDEAIGVPDALGRRVARNTHTILGRESHVGAVIDPAGGSFYVETLTDQLARAAWSQLQAIEAAGGMKRFVASGAAAAQIDAAWQQRAQRIATRRDAVTGVSEFANLEEERLVRVAVPGAARSQGAIPVHRDAEMFERLRDATDAAVRRPAVFLANLGPLREHKARAGYARNFFAAAGLEVIDGQGAVDARALATELAASGCTVACICGSDERYAELADVCARALISGGAKQLLLAGNVPSLRTALAAAGVARFIHLGCDVHDDLSWLLTELGVLS